MLATGKAKQNQEIVELLVPNLWGLFKSVDALHQSSYEVLTFWCGEALWLFNVNLFLH